MIRPKNQSQPTEEQKARNQMWLDMKMGARSTGLALEIKEKVMRESLLSKHGTASEESNPDLEERVKQFNSDCELIGFPQFKIKF